MNDEVRFSRVIVGFAIGTASILGIVGGTLGRKPVEKIATALAMPSGMIWYVLTGLVLTAWISYQRKLAAMLFVSWAMFSVAGNGLFVTWLVTTLEGPYVQIDPLQSEPYDVVVLLGGGASIAANDRPQGNASGDRLILAAQLYHQGLAKRLICTGRRIEGMDSIGIDPAQASATVLQGLGVPESAIEQLGGRTTSEEMETLGERFSDSEQRVGVVTSAWHLPRAMRLANRNNFQPDPLPADFLSEPKRTLTTAETILAYIPSADSLHATTRVTKEYLGMLVGR